LFTVIYVVSVPDALRRFPNISCELLTSDVGQITDALVDCSMLFSSLMNYLESDSPLNPLQASFYGKLVALLISRKGELVWHCCVVCEK